MVEYLSAMPETRVQSLGWEDSLKGMASVLQLLFNKWETATVTQTTKLTTECRWSEAKADEAARKPDSREVTSALTEHRPVVWLHRHPLAGFLYSGRG